ncbi:10 kDa chaperonin 2, chloroplastic-like isoform X2 [Hibiscus syriacus]|uniref:10 kDa chaperonin 2, chloroplastic-like isoform X2 n=1 Tax=Hibiscus syriacus TaxID=106335 RepID=UPI00192114D5|nr:10 kDa chaperonin 2, chloroplastic-like isoform X2 [Hibiscus syriacus]
MASAFLSAPISFTLYKPTIPSLSSRNLLGSRGNCLRIKASKWEPTKVVPQADRVLIRLQELPEKSAGGVLLPKSAVKFERHLTGEIVSVGAEVGQVETGKKVLLSDVNAYEVDLGTDTRHVFCKESDLLAEVE